MRRARRVKPSTVAGRKRAAELGRVIASPRTSKSDRAAALAELNQIAPLATRAETAEESILSEKGTPASASMLLEQPPAPPHRNETEPDWKKVPKPARVWNALEFRCLVLLQDLQARGHATRPCFTSDAALRLFWENSIGFTFEDLDRIERAFIDAVGQLPVNDKILPTREQAKAEQFDWGPAWEKASSFYFAGLPAKEQKRLKDVFTSLSRFDWLKLAAPSTPPLARATKSVAEPQPDAHTNDSELRVMAKRDTPELRPEILDRTDEAARLQSRAELVLSLDASLTQLANLSADMRQQILSAITAQIQSTGLADGLFCLKTYNTLRPKARADFPERRFTWMAQ